MTRLPSIHAAALLSCDLMSRLRRVLHFVYPADPTRALQDVQPDVLASNGVVHGITRVLFPPPLFTKEQAIAQAAATNASMNGTLLPFGSTLPPATTTATPGAIAPTNNTPLPAAAPVLETTAPAVPGAAENATVAPATAAAATPVPAAAAAAGPSSPPVGQVGRKLMEQGQA